MEYYLSHPDRNVRHILTKFRLSDHKPLIEIGRYLKIPRDKRLCATAAKFVKLIPIFFLAYLVPLDVNVVPIKFHQFLFGE
jgi:hypothetical protein